MEEDLVTIETYDNPAEAHIVRAKLGAAGIPCFIADDITVQLEWSDSNIGGGVRLQVAEEHVSEAMGVLRGNPKLGGITFPMQDTDEVQICPHCGAEEATPARYSKKTILLCWLLLGLPLPFLRRRWHCEQCGHEWKGR